MKSADYASSKTALASALQISRPTLYSHLRKQDAPRPKSNGMWKLSEVRKYIAKQEGKRELKSTEKQELELQLLRKRIRIAELQISDLDNSRTEQIASQITAECKRVIETFNAQLQAMPNQLSGIFSALGEPMPIYQRFKAELRQRFQAAYAALHMIEKKSQRKTNFVSFNRSKGNGAIVLDGPGHNDIEIIATAMLRGLPRAEAKRVRPVLVRKLRRTFNELERKLCDELPHECEGKTQYEIADILGRAINDVMATEMDLIELEFL